MSGTCSYVPSVLSPWVCYVRGIFQVPELESKVAELIISNDISARIDSTKSTLHAKHTEQRAVSCRKVRGWGFGLA